MSESLTLVLFNLFVVMMLALDLGVFQRRAHFPSMKEALIWSGVWILLAMLFCLYIGLTSGGGKALLIDAKNERFVDNADANKMLTREYRKGFEVPARI